MKLPIRVSEDSKEPIYHQIESQIKALIVAGQLKSGEMMPSIRALSHDLACSVITTRRAYLNLENEGYIRTVQGKGTFINKLEAEEVDQTKLSLIYQSMAKAIEQAKQMGCSREEVDRIYGQVLRDIFENANGKA